MRSMRLTQVFGVLAVLLFATLVQAAEPSVNAKKNAADRPRLALVISEFEYHTYETVPAFAAANFAQDFQIESAINSDENCQELPGINILHDADLAILCMWRRTLPPEQLAAVKDYVAAGKPLVALRSACHAFVTRDGTTPEGKESWPTFDRDVLGCHYAGHHANYAKQGMPPTHVWFVPEAKNNPLLSGIHTDEFIAPSWLYKLQPLSEGAETLMMGRVADREPHEPVTWTYLTKQGGRVFYTSLGSPDDFQLPQFRRLLRNAVYWAANQPIPTTAPQ